MSALADFWRHTPPAALQLRRIALAIGIKPERSAAPASPDPERAMDSAMEQARSIGMAVAHGRPDDPMLSFLDL